MFLPPSERALAEAYIFGDIDLPGDLEAATGIGERLIDEHHSVSDWMHLTSHLLPRLLSLPRVDHHEDASPEDASPSTTYPMDATRAVADHTATASLSERRLAASLGHGARHTQSRDARAIRFHYDVGNDFYALWLDQRMIYSCAYFEQGTEDIDTAQRAKLDHICRKLDLQPGDRLLDIGCGWGGLILHAASQYGVEALGVTLSPSQAEVARARAVAAGLSDRCRVEVCDYRALPSASQFNKIVSVGMVEHVGRDHLSEYFTTAYQLLEPGGLFLNHGIISIEGAHPHPRLDAVRRRIWGQDSFIPTYVFPDGQLVPLSTMLTDAETAQFEVRDVENLREHYALTLRHWVRRLEHAHEAATAIVGEPTYRVWRLYMAASAHAFASGRIGIAQSVLAKPQAGKANMPLTRRAWYLANERAVS
jgi:cyclopropane-fatty-acyl-phospholipid synthase